MNYKSFEFVIYNWLDGLNFIVCKVQKIFLKYMLMLWEILIIFKGMYFVVCLFKSRDIFKFERKKKYGGLFER